MKLLKLFLVSTLALGILSGCQTQKSELSLYDEILDKKEIIFATEGTYAPFTYHNENGDLVGYDVDIALAVAKKLGVKASFVETKWDSIIAGLDANKYDVVANQVGINEERAENHLFSTPYTYVYGAVIVRDDYDKIQSFSNIKGKKLAQTTTSNWADVVRSSGGDVVATEGFNQSLELVLTSRVDATLNDAVVFYDFMKNKPESKLKIATLSDDYTETAFIFRKNNSTELVNAINKALQELKEEGKLTEISNKYFGEDVSIPQ